LRRNTSAIRYTIQTRPINQATKAPIHHHILLTSPSLNGLIYVNGFCMA
jgi:hypothetical protein